MRHWLAYMLQFLIFSKFVLVVVSYIQCTVHIALGTLLAIYVN